MIGVPAVLLSETVQTVHTSGVNWVSVATIVAAVVVLVTAIFGAFAKYVSTQITSSINVFRIEVVAKLDSRLGKVEDKLTTISTNNPKRSLDERGRNYGTVYWDSRNSGGHYGTYYGA